MSTIKVFKRSKPNRFSDKGTIEFVIANNNSHILVSSNLAQLANTVEKAFLSNGGKVLYEISKNAPNFSREFNYSNLNTAEITQFKRYVSSAKRKYGGRRI